MPPNGTSDDALQLVAGGTSFYGTICIAQLAQGFLGVTRSYLVVSSALGCGSVVAGCCATAFCTDLVHQVGKLFSNENENQYIPLFLKDYQQHWSNGGLRETHI